MPSFGASMAKMFKRGAANGQSPSVGHASVATPVGTTGAERAAGGEGRAAGSEVPVWPSDAEKTTVGSAVAAAAATDDD
eukprot:6175963-Pleurochrysis_carterae.AAC.3